MKIDKLKLEEEFKKYYSEKGKTATHVFVFSKEQSLISDYHSSMSYDFKKCYINGLVYSEMRGRDSKNDTFLFDDTIFLCVGNHNDISRH